jgi:hypothetical protein
MRVIGYLMVLAAAFVGATAVTAGDCYGVQQAQFAPAYSTGGCYAASAAVYAPAVQQVVVQRQVQYAVAAPVYVQQQAFVQKQVVVQRQFAQQAYGYGGFQQAQFGGFRQRQFVGGGFGGGPFRQGFQQGGIIGGLERFTGLGNGSGDFGRGAIIGVLGARSNLFGLGRR